MTLKVINLSLHVDSTQRDKKNPLPTRRHLHSPFYCCASVYHFPTCRLTAQTQKPSLVSTGVSAAPRLSLSDARSWQHAGWHNRGKNLSRSSMAVGDEGQMPCCYLSGLGWLTGWTTVITAKFVKKKAVKAESKRFAGPKPSEPIAAMDLRKFYAGRRAASITCFVLLSGFMSIHLHTEAVVFTSLAHTTFLGQAVLTPKIPGLLKSVFKDEKVPWDWLPGVLELFRNSAPELFFRLQKFSPRVPEKVLDPSIKFPQCLKSFCLAWQLDCWDFNLEFSSW